MKKFCSMQWKIQSVVFWNTPEMFNYLLLASDCNELLKVINEFGDLLLDVKCAY